METNFRLNVHPPLLQSELFQPADNDYAPRRVAFFEPARIVFARGWNRTPFGQSLAEKVASLYPKIVPENFSDTAHPKIVIDIEVEERMPPALAQHVLGKQTLVIGEHCSAVRLSSEEGNTCPNYWHFSLYGFCPYGCTYCYLAGTPGVKFSPSIKIFTNIDEVLNDIDKHARKIEEPTAFYHGKLQDGLALDPLSGYSRRLIPFFAEQPFARQILRTKSADVENLLDLEHNRHTILSWTLQPPEISEQFEPDTPSIAERLRAMKQCVDAGYPIRAVLMPLIPVPNWLDLYVDFLEQLLSDIPIQRLTIGAICSYQSAYHLMNRKLGSANVIAENMEHTKTEDGRKRYPEKLREKAYRQLIQAAKRCCPDIEIGLCLETHTVFESLDLQNVIGQCNCVL
jgi:DNA repair photolyase